MTKSAHSPEIKAFIRRHNALFWYTPEDKKEEISEEFLVETILNYGDMNSVKELIAIMGAPNYRVRNDPANDREDDHWVSAVG